jgi:tetratricopeptide (TPR) repeat protein
VFNAGLVLGGIFFSTVQNTPVSIQSPPAWIAEVAESAGRAADSDPLNAGYRYAVGNSQALLGHPGQAETHYRKALFLQPLNSYIIEKMALIQAKQGKPAIASALFQSAIVFDRFNPHRYLTYAAWLFSADRTQEGAQMAREAIKRDPQSLDSALMLMVANGLGDMAIQSAIPKQGQSYLAYARFLSSMGKRQEAAMAFREAVAYVSADQPGAKTVLREVAAHYREQNHLEDALATMQVALSLFPKDPTLRFETGMLYEKTGIAYRAVQEYLVVLALEPGNLSARQRLDALGAK